jgi:predicted nuclease of predicted toxin-antitoxin system
MSKFFLDEDMPGSTARVLRARGHEVLDVWECGLSGKSDEEIYRYAMKEHAIIITRDRGFGNLYLQTPGVNPGIVIAHFPNEVSNDKMNRRLDIALLLLPENDIRGNLVIIEPGRLRIRRRLV